MTFETPPPLHPQEFPIPSVGGVWAFSGTTHFLMNSKLFPIPQHSFCHKSEVLRILSIFLFRNNRNFGVSNGCRDDIKETTIFDATNIIQNSSECEILLKSLYLCSFRPTYHQMPRSIWYFLVTIAIRQVHTYCGDNKKFHPMLTMETFYKVQVLHQNTLCMIFWGMEIPGQGMKMSWVKQSHNCHFLFIVVL